MTMRASEKSEQAAIVELLETLGAQVWVLGTRRPRGDYQGTRQTPGVPDLYAAIPTGRYAVPIWIEVKSSTGRLRPAQITFRDACARAGHAHLVGGVDVVLEFLTAHAFVKEYPCRENESPSKAS